MFCATAYARAAHPVRARIYGSASRVVRDAPNGVTGIGGQVGIVDLRGMMRFCRGCQNLLQMQAAPRRGRRSDANMQGSAAPLPENAGSRAVDLRRNLETGVLLLRERRLSAGRVVYSTNRTQTIEIG